jgi:ectoine hydroxylase-related dioxygenase (phytanoyl-CoA dioxygenase family)
MPEQYTQGFQLQRGKVPDAARAFFENNGYLVVREVLGSGMVRRLDGAFAAIMRDRRNSDDEDIWYGATADGDSLVERFIRLDARSEVLRDFCTSSPAMVAIARSLVGPNARCVLSAEGTPGVLMMIKDARDVGPRRVLPWHIDETPGPGGRSIHFITVGVYLDQADVDRGCLVVIPGSHRSPPAMYVPESAIDPAREMAVEANRGDVVVHSSRLLHCSRGCRQPGAVRRILYATYRP